jgi:hypothetical protein
MKEGSIQKSFHRALNGNRSELRISPTVKTTIEQPQLIESPQKVFISALNLVVAGGQIRKSY